MARSKREEGHQPLTPAEHAAEAAAIEADALFEQLMAANAAPEPGTRTGTAVARNAAKDIGLDDPTGQLSVPMVAAQVESAGYTVVYDQQTGEQSTVNNNMLKQALAKLDPITKAVMFGLRPPRRNGAVVVPFRGALKCRLHPDDPDRPTWDAMGFAVCTKDNLRTEHARDMHLRNRHKDEAKAIKEREEKQERAEQRLERRALLNLVSGGAIPPSAA